MKIIVSPGSKEITKDAQDLFGISRVVSGVWREPVSINSLSTEEATLAKEYFEEQGKRVQMEE